MGWGSWTSAREQSDSECEMAEGQLLSFINEGDVGVMWGWCEGDVMWCDVMWCNMIWYDMIWYDVMWCDLMWCDVMCCVVKVMWWDVIWCDVTWCDLKVIWGWCGGDVRVIWCDVMWFDVMWSDLIWGWCDVIWCDVRMMWCDVMVQVSMLTFREGGGGAGTLLIMFNKNCRNGTMRHPLSKPSQVTAEFWFFATTFCMMLLSLSYIGDNHLFKIQNTVS